MLVLITYDVSTQDAAGKARLRKVAKECVNYGQRVQNSVFECILDASQLLLLKNRLVSLINETNHVKGILECHFPVMGHQGNAVDAGQRGKFFRQLFFLGGP